MSTAPSPWVTSSHQAQIEARMALAMVSDEAMPVLVLQPAVRAGLPKAPKSSAPLYSSDTLASAV